MGVGPPEVPAWRDALASDRFAFEQELRAAGFEERVDGWYGTIKISMSDGPAADQLHVITLPDDFPFSPPAIRQHPLPTKLTWHLSPLGTLCLYRRGEQSAEPWRTAVTFLKRVRQWYADAAAGWPDDPGDPDLDRYFLPVGDETLLSYDNLDGLIRHYLVLEPVKRQPWLKLRAKTPPRGSDERKKRKFWAYAMNVGVLDAPVHNWDTLLDCLEEPDRAELIQLVAGGKSGYLVIKYARDGSEGLRISAIALFVSLKVAGATPFLGTIPIVDSSRNPRFVRAGVDAEFVSQHRVAVVGCGAVGSFTADALARCGCRRFILVDDDRLMPGNCIRHLADHSHVPKYKVLAVRDILVGDHALERRDIVCYEKRVTPELALELLETCDVVIDATGDAAAHRLLEHMAEIAAGKLVEVYLQRDGEVVRVDRFGGGACNDRVEEITPLDPNAPAYYREVGCGDPVSPAAPWAAYAAAAAVVRYVIDFMRPRRRPRLADSVVEVLVPQPDFGITQR